MTVPNQDHQEPTNAAYQQAEALDVEGIEIFEDVTGNDTFPKDNQEATSKLSAGLPIKDAARFLKVSPNTIRSRIKSGELAACKVKGPTGDEWRVFFGSLPTPPKQTTNALPMDPPDQTRLLDLVEKQAAKLEVAAGQIGYLKSQLEEREREVESHKEQIKLLTDSQHQHHSWWRHFASWMGGSVR